MEKELKSYQSVDANASNSVLGFKDEPTILDFVATLFIAGALILSFIRLVIEIKNHD